MKSAKFTGAAAYLPGSLTLPALQAAVQDCRGCDLYKNATQAVFGEGRASARIVMVGEQPGNEEDVEGRPFVGPAGKILQRAIQEVGLAADDVYITNVVKHFKFEERGKRRIHKKPGAAEVEACIPWLKAEIGCVQPKVIVCLGATAAQALLGRSFRLTKEHGRFVEHPLAPYVTATLHPSAILRAPDRDQRHAAYQQLVTDLRNVREALESRVTRAGRA
ncbi:MAG TPA: UdgX family uracil-DNA binding protein [Bryobacteraceae bacterium]|nr:UdgX family uracil-DNA binding protein [Bryobacteraceae bacterium]